MFQKLGYKWSSQQNGKLQVVDNKVSAGYL